VTKARLLSRTAIALLALGLGAPILAAPALAQVTTIPEPGPGDPRIRQIMYDENQIVSIRGRLGYEITIEFDPDERIENVSIGDSLSWQVTPNRRATLLFIKPMARSTPTSMTVATNRRLYSFLLTAVEARPNDPDAMFRLRFLYAPPPEPPAPPPPPPPPPPPTPQDFNFAYTYSGTRSVYPIRVFDDGRSTYFEFPEGRESPAVFVTGVDNREEMANTRVVGRYAVVDMTARNFVLRYGRARAQVTNTAWREPTVATRSSAPPADQLPPLQGGPGR
jgi:type IV secretion system protein VirB9